MTKIDLNGQWNISCPAKNITLTGQVPGDIHKALLDNNMIDDPFFGANEEKYLWIGENDWIWSREFTVDREMLEQDKILLVCFGLDTLATLTLNGRELGKTNNMFRKWEFDLAGFIKEGVNTLSVKLDSAVQYAWDQDKKADIPYFHQPQHTPCPFPAIRKEQSNFGWDWGVKLVTCGIWREIEIQGVSKARLTEVKIGQKHNEDGSVTVNVHTELDRLSKADLTAHITLTHEGQIIAKDKIDLKNNTGNTNLTVSQPHLWWPNNMGDQPLYELELILAHGDQELDRDKKTLGLRKLELDRHSDEWGESFQFVANGIPFFVKGANWIPVDAVLARVTPADYERLILDAVKANMNMLRVWGGGLYEADIFYELCDKYGITVWQDFMYACHRYPLDQADFKENATREAAYQIKRIRHHSCLAILSGNNEMEQMSVSDKWEARKMPWDVYKSFFDDVLGSLTAELCPDIPYWPSSPHSPLGDRNDHNNPSCGDAHLWDVWHGKKPFEWYRTTEHRFVSEFGFQSFPEPKTVYSYTEPKDRNITSYVMELHQRSGIGNTTIMQYMLDWYRLPCTFENTIWASQILQGMAITYAVEHWRRNMPRQMGSMYWQHNDYWPVASWASIDYYGRWKALHYMAKRFYAPLMISGVEDWDRGTAEIYVTSDLMKMTAGKVSWQVTNLEGSVKRTGNLDVNLEPGKSCLVDTLDLSDIIKEQGNRNTLLWLSLEGEAGEISRTTVMFCRPKHMELTDNPGIEHTITDKGDGSFEMVLTTHSVALWTWFELDKADAQYSDSFFHLCPGQKYVVNIEPKESLTLSDVEDQLIIRSLVDTYKEIVQ
jgi:beta-mannosidase